MSGIDVATTGEAVDYDGSAGYRLRCAREQLSLSIRDVATALNLLVSHVRAIEANRYDALANDEQFLRRLHSYARLVDLDANEVVDVYRMQSATVSEQDQPAAPKKREHGVWPAVGALAITCVCLAIWWLTQTVDFESSENASTRLATGAANPASVPPATEHRKETTRPGAKNLAAVDATAARSDQAASELNQEQAIEGAVNTPLGKNALTAVGALPLKITLIDLKNDASAQAPISAAQVGASTQLRSNEWFAGLDPDRYTLQLLSLTKEASTRAFIQNRHLQEQAAYFTVRNDDQKIWYAITYGLYDSFDAAESASKSLPDSIKDLKPKVRNTGRIQQLMLP